MLLSAADPMFKIWLHGQKVNSNQSPELVNRIFNEFRIQKMFQTYFLANTVEVVLTSRNTRLSNFWKPIVLVEREREMEKKNKIREKQTTKTGEQKTFWEKQKNEKLLRKESLKFSVLRLYVRYIDEF